MKPSDLPLQFYVHAVIVVDGRFALQLRDESLPHPKTWGLFGGGIEAEEHEETALRRELLEELELRDFECKFLIEFERWAFYVVEITAEQWSRHVLHEGERAELFSHANLPVADAHPLLRMAIEAHRALTWSP